MNLRQFIPAKLKNYIKNIMGKNSYYISPAAQNGKGCVIHSGVFIGKNVIIGDFSHINHNARIISGNIVKFCSIAYGCLI